MSRPSRPLVKASRPRAGSDLSGMHEPDFDLALPGEEEAPQMRASALQRGGQLQLQSGGTAAVGSAVKAARAQKAATATATTAAAVPPPVSSSGLVATLGRPMTGDSRSATASSVAASASRHFALTPSTIDFHGVTHSNIYFMILTLQNIGIRRRPVRFTPPSTDQFSLEVPTLHTELNPGLSLKLKVYFQCPPEPTQTSSESDEEFAARVRTYASQSWHDQIVVQSGEGRNEQFVIPLHAWSPRASLQFNSLIDFGAVQSGSSPSSMASQVLSIRNIGAFAGRFRVEFDQGTPVTVTPSSGELTASGQPGSSIQLRVDLSTNELPLGPYRILGRLFVDEQVTPLLLDLNAVLVDASLQLIWPALNGGGPGATLDLANLSAQQLERVAEVYFGNLYFGETRRVEAVLVNNTPSSLNFLVNLADSRDDKNGGGSLESSRVGSESAREQRSIAGSVLGDHDLDEGHSGGASSGPAVYHRPDILIQPMEGRLDPYAGVKIVFIFQPTQPRHLVKEMSVGFKSLTQGATVERPEPPFVRYNAICRIDSLDGKYHVGVPVCGHANVPCAQVSSDLFDFGPCAVREHVDLFVTLKNTSSSLPLAFEFEHVAQFAAEPSFGSLGPREARRVRLSFRPKNLGVFRRQTMKLKLLGTPDGKRPTTLVPRGARATNQQPQQINEEALVIYTLTLSGVSETVGVNRTLQLTTGGSSKLAKDFGRPLVLVKAPSDLQEEKELAALASADARVIEDDEEEGVDGDPAFKVVAASSSSTSSSALPRGSKKAFHRVSGWDRPELASQYTGRYEVQPGSLDARVTFTPAELKARSNNKDFYKTFLKDQRRTREESGHKSNPIVFESPDANDPDRPVDVVGMGLAFADGLAEPSVPLPPPAEKLKLHYSMAGFEGEGRKRLVKKPSAASTGPDAPRKVFKSAPSTRAEKRDCEAVLSPEELQTVIRGPKLLEFGKLCVSAVATRDFTVTNDLEQHILVEVRTACVAELAGTTRTSQMVPPGETAVFPISFTSDREQEFSQSVVYSINGHHDYNFIATSFVVPMDLALSREELQFEFRQDNATFGVTEAVVLDNIFTVPVPFYFSTPSGLDCFTVTPIKGVVPPQSRLKVEVRFEPKTSNATVGASNAATTGAAGGTNQTLTSAELVLRVVDGTSKRVALRALLAEASCSFARGLRSVDFGVMCVGSPVTKSVVLRNSGSSRTVYRFEDLPPGVQIRPPQGKLEVGASATIAITVYPTPNLKLKHAVTVQVRGRARDAKPLRLQLKGEAVMPVLGVLEDEIAFGGVTIGSSASRLVSLRNTGTVPASVLIDLTRAQEFGLSYADHLGQEEVTDSGGVSRHAVIQRISTAAIKRNGSTSTLEAAEMTAARDSNSPGAGGAVAGGSSGSPSSNYRAEDEDLAGYSIFLAPRAVVAFTLTYTPTRVIEHAFEMPLVVAGIPTYAALRRVVTAHGLKPRISLSTPALDFGRRVLLKRGRAAKNPYVQKFVLRSEDASTLTWFLHSDPQAPSTPASGFGTPSVSSRMPSRLGTASPAASAASEETTWRLEPTSGTLAPGQEVVVMAYFSPTAAISYSHPVDIYLDSPPGSIETIPEPAPRGGVTASSSSLGPVGLRPYTSLQLTGFGTTPRLIFDVDEVSLPTVPLGIKSQATFHIRNEGYENLELRYELNMDATRAPLTIRLPEGSTLGVNHPVLPVEITLLAKKPVSFALQLHFFDNEEHRFSLPVVGTSDNSVLTVQTYLEAHPGAYDIVESHPPPASDKFVASTSLTSMLAASKVLTLVEVKEPKDAKLLQARGRKAIYQGLRTTTTASRPRTGYDFDDATDPDAGDNDAEMDDADFIGDDAVGALGSGTRSTMGEDEASRLTPVKMLGQSSLAGGDSLYSHTLESVLAYLDASKLLSSAEAADEEFGGGTDTPPHSPPFGKSIDLAAATSNAAAQRVAAGKEAAAAAAAAASTPKNHTTRGGGASMSISADTFPADLVRSQGRIVRSLIRALSGKTVPTQTTKKAAMFSRDKDQTTIVMSSTLPSAAAAAAQLQRPSSSESQSLGFTTEFLPPSAATGSSKADEVARTAYLDYEDLLIFLKAQGCLLGGLAPWHLLSWSQLLRLLLSPSSTFTELGVTSMMSASEVATRQRALERDFPRLSRQAWLTVLVQVLKVFVLTRVTPTQFRALPGMSPDLPCMSYNYAASNVYSIGESILLEWLHFHYNRTNPLHPRQVTDFQRSLSDGLVLAGVLQSHVPHIGALAHLRTHILTTDDCVYNATKFLAALREVGLTYRLTPSQLVNAHMRDMVLLVLFLYQRLPSYVPRSTIEFRGALDEDMVKCIELSNPSSKAITYAVHLEGSPDFRVDSYAVRLAARGRPGATVKFPLRFRARFSKPVEARLVFHSADAAGSSHASASTLVFLLKSHVQSRTPVASHSVTARVYEPTSVDVRVTNTFGADCTFQVAVKLDQEPSPAAGKNIPSGAGPKADAAAAALRQQSGLEALVNEGGKRAAAGNAGRLGSARSNASSRSTGVSSDRLPPPIFCPYERVKLRAGESATLHLQFLPLRIGAYRAQLVFLDESVGEFMVEVVGTATPPPPSELFKWTTRSRSTESREVQFSYRNAGLDLARAATFDRIRALSRQQRDLKKNKADWPFQILKADLLPPSTTVHYNVAVNSPFFQVAPQMLLHDVRLEKDAAAKKAPQVKGKSGGLPLIVTDLTIASASKDDHKRSVASLASAGTTPLPTGPIFGGSAALTASRAAPDNKLSVLFHPRGPGVYRGDIVLTSLFDARVYSLEVTVLADEAPPSLEFRVPARQSVTQDIPVANPSNDVWTLKATFTGGKHYFTGPPDVTVFPNTTGAYPLAFTPPWVGQSEGVLTLYNSRTDEKFTYDLRGVGDEPLAERHVLIQAPARSTVQHTVPVTNESATDLYYTVECDLATFEGPSNFRVPAGATEEYTFTLNPSLSGTVFGALTFHQADKRFQWFSVELVVSAPEAEETVTIGTACRKASTVAVAITNPTDAPLTMEVGLEGIGLFGPKHLALAPNETRAYEFLYSPLLPVEAAEGSLSFSSEAVGEFWYRLLLTATPPEPELVVFDGVEVGTSRSLEVVLENPTDEAISLKAVSSLPRNFAAKPAAFTIPPLTSQTVELRYTPSSIGEEQTATIGFKHPVVGNWTFACSGVGRTPAEMPPTRLATPVGTSISRTIAFRNPFGTKMRIDIDLAETTTSSVVAAGAGATTPTAPPAPTFQLFMKRARGLVLGPYSALQIPFIFAPGIIADHAARLTVVAPDERLTWTFPLHGVAEGLTSDQPIVLRTRARETVSEVREVRLQGLPALPSGGVEAFRVELESEEDVRPALEQALRLSLLTPQLTNASQPLRVQLDLAPRVPVKARAFLVVAKVHGGGRWRFPLVVSVEPPSPDDTLRLEAPVNGTSSVAFRLRNTRAHAVPFTATLSSESSATFHVWPRTGVMRAPTSAEDAGTQFVVSFSPTEYGKPLTGAVHIQTADMFYVYALVGTHPRYEPPKEKSHLDNHNESFKSLSSPHGGGLSTSASPRRNIVAANVRAAKDQPVLAQQVSKVKAWKGSGNTSSIGSFGTPPVASQASTARK